MIGSACSTVPEIDGHFCAFSLGLAVFAVAVLGFREDRSHVGESPTFLFLTQVDHGWKGCQRRGWKSIENWSERPYNHPFMSISVRSFAKINLGLRIGALRAHGFHELRTVYQTIALHDEIRVSVVR